MAKARELMDQARAWVKEGRYDEATERYAWLWDNVLASEPSMAGVRGSYMVSEMGKLATLHLGAKERFTALRDRAEQAAESEDTDERSARHDWICLNDIVGDTQRTLAWFERARAALDFRAHYPHIGITFAPWLQRHGHWAQAAFFIEDGPAEVDHDFHMWKAHDHMIRKHPMMSERPELADVNARMFRQKAAAAVVSLRAAGRDDEAAATLEAARRLDPDPKLTVSLAELLAKTPHARQEDLAMLDTLDAPERDRRQLLEKRLSGAAPAEPDPNPDE